MSDEINIDNLDLKEMTELVEHAAQRVVLMEMQLSSARKLTIALLHRLGGQALFATSDIHKLNSEYNFAVSVEAVDGSEGPNITLKLKSKVNDGNADQSGK